MWQPVYIKQVKLLIFVAYLLPIVREHPSTKHRSYMPFCSLVDLVKNNKLSETKNITLTLALALYSLYVCLSVLFGEESDLDFNVQCNVEFRL